MIGALAWFALGPAWAADLSGAVYDADGAPLAGVPVVAYDQRLDYATATTTTDGGWAMTGLPAGRYRVRAAPEAVWPARFWPDDWSYCGAEAIALGEHDAAADLDLILPLGGTLIGQVLTPDGGPAAGVTVRCEGADSRTSGLRYSGQTDAEGRFEITGIDAGDGGSLYALDLSGGGWPDQYAGETYSSGSADLYPAELGQTADVAPVTLLPGIQVSGWVEDSDGQPVEIGSVQVYASSQVTSADVQPGGAWFAEGLPPGDVLIWASIDGYGLSYWPDHDRPAETIPAPDEGDVLEELVLVMADEARLNGQLVSADGSDPGDLSGVTVLAFNDEGTVGIGDGVEADGSFSLGRLQGGDYTLYVYAEDEGFLDDYAREGGEPRVFEIVHGAESPIYEIALTPGGSIEGIVTDETGAPVYGAYVYAQSSDDEASAEVGVTDRDGAYRIDGLVADSYLVSALYSPYCEQDPGYVAAYWQDQRHPDYAVRLPVDAGERLEGIDLVMPVDVDGDGMGDAWEEEHGLDVGRDDADEDPDGDGYSNLEEYLLGTDPTSEDAPGGCGCASAGSAQAPLAGLWSLALAGLRRRGGRARG